MADYREFPWRVGRSVGRTVYAAVGPEASKADILIGMMDSRALAIEVVDAHNLLLGKRGRVTSEEQAEYTAKLHRARQDNPS